VQWRECAGHGLAQPVIDSFTATLNEIVQRTTDTTIDVNGVNGSNGMSDRALVAALRRQMTTAVAKQVAAAGNLAMSTRKEGLEVRVLRVGRDANQSALVKPDKVSSVAGRLKKARCSLATSYQLPTTD
jgi:RecJ-like exonuclease